MCLYSSNMWNLKGRGQRQRRYSRQNLNGGVGLHGYTDGTGRTLLSYRPSLAAKTVKLVRTGHFQSSWINAILLHLCLPVALSDTYPEGMYRHTTTPPWITRGWVEDVPRMEQSKTSVPPGFFLWGAGVFVCVPRLPLLPMLGSLASAIQLYSGGMETGLRSPGTTNQQSEYWLRGGVAGRWWLRQCGRQLGERTSERCVQVRGHCTIQGLLCVYLTEPNLWILLWLCYSSLLLLDR